MLTGGRPTPAGGARMKITAIHTHYVRIPFDMGAPKQEFAGLRFPDHGSPADPSGDGRRHHRLGRGLRPFHHPRHQGGARELRGAVVHRQGPDRHQCAARARPRRRSTSSAATARWFTRTPASTSRCGISPASAPVCRSAPARQRAAQGGPCLRQPDALRHPRHRRAHLRRDGRAAASATSSCTSTASRRSRPHARAQGPTSPS